MAITFTENDSIFRLTTKNTLYAFSVYGNYLKHLYYGKKRVSGSLDFDRDMLAFSPYLEGEWKPTDIFPQECSFYGSGDYRIPSLRIKNPTGDSCTRFFYDSYKIFSGRKELPNLPFSRADANTKTLCINMKDPDRDIFLKLYYTVFYECDTISRYMEIENHTGETVVVEKCMPLCLELPSMNYEHWTFYGHHNHERCLQKAPLHHGIQSICSRRGATSHHYNPFMAIAAENVTEDKGEIYGCNLVYSGSFLGEVEVDQQDTTRVLLGLGYEDFSMTLENDERFCSPEAVMTFSKDGYGGMARNFHHFVNNHIVPEKCYTKPHPVVLNTWEACWFDIDEEKLVTFAEECAKLGIDMLVMDDGWFGNRNDDTTSLGDWTPNPKKFKNGLGSFVRRVKEKGIKFGIWIEPEMISPKSELYKKHPEWCLRANGRQLSLGREQLILDMGNTEVIEYLKDLFSKVFDSVGIDYFKWDMNRHMSEVGSVVLPKERQGEAFYRYMLGTYSLMSWLREHYPDAFLETCSGGGGRYDLGMMTYGDQIWTSDNTNPYFRIWIQYGSLMGYPPTQMSCHVSNPGSDRKSLDFRYKVALGGMLGYEMNILDSNDAVKNDISEQVKQYRTFEHIIRTGDFYPLYSPFEHPYSAYYYTSSDCKEFLVSFIQAEDCFNRCKKKELKPILKIKNAKPDKIYKDVISGKEFSGTELRHGIIQEVAGENDRAVIYHLKQI